MEHVSSASNGRNRVVGNALGDLELEMHILVPLTVPAQLRDASVAHEVGVCGLCACRYHQLHFAIERRDAQGGAQHGLRQRQRHLHVHVVVVAPEERVISHLTVHIHVAGRATKRTHVAFAS